MSDGQGQQQIFPAMREAMRACGYVKADGVNTFSRYNFKKADDIYAEVRGALAEAGISTTVEVLSHAVQQYDTSKDKKTWSVRGLFRVTFWALDGSKLWTDVLAEGADTGDKSFPKVMTMAMKYALIDTFLLSTGEGMDAEESSPEFHGATNKGAAHPQVQTSPAKEQPDYLRITQEQIGEIVKLQAQLGWDPKKGDEMCEIICGCNKLGLDRNQANTFIANMRDRVLRQPTG